MAIERSNPQILGSQMMQHIYAIEDEAGVRHYIGKTGNLKRRRAELLSAFNFPIFIVSLQRVTEANWQERERHWIAHGRAAGWPLRNVDAGGTGTWENTEEWREQFRGRVATEETRQKMSDARRGVPKSVAHKKAIGAGNSKPCVARSVVLQGNTRGNKSCVFRGVRYPSITAAGAATGLSSYMLYKNGLEVR